VLAALRYAETMGDTTPLHEADADVLTS
jgi:hypothetical protein